MKKNFKFMLVALLALFGFNSAFAQLPAEITKGNFVYENVTITDAANKKATATIKEVATGKEIVASDGTMSLGDGVLSYTIGDDTWEISVIGFKADVTKNRSTAKKVTIPAAIKAIPEEAFYNCSNLYEITFEANSQVETIGTHAFATTQIANFDFSNCVKLEALPDEVFVEPGLNNTYITEVTVPTGALFKHINGAFKNLTALTAINGLGDSWIQEVIPSAFDGCDALTELSLPGKNLQYVDANALKGSSIETLSIDLGSIILLGGVDITYTPDYVYTYTTTAHTDNLYGDAAIDLSPLSSLTLKNTAGVGTGSLTGKIAAYAFAYCDLIDDLLNLSSVNFGTTAQIEGSAFATCYDGTHETGIRGVKIGNITDNQSGDYTIDDNAFTGCNYLTTVEIGNITTASAIGVAAFGNQLVSVKIGTVKADNAAFAVGAFVWATNADEAELLLAQGPGEYLNANNVSVQLIPAGAFDMSSIASATTLPVIKIGEIRSAGGVFASGSITSPVGLSELTFNGPIAANGLDAAIFSADLGLTTITFTKSIGAAGIATGAFNNLTGITTLVFNGKLVANAVDEGAFAITNDGTSSYSLTYTYAYTDADDYTVNPFNVKAMNAAAVDGDDNRFIVLNVTDANLLANFKDAAMGINGTNTDPTKFDIYFVQFATVSPDIPVGFLVYRNENQKSMAWGRYDLGSFTLEAGPDVNGDGTPGDYSGMITNGMIIDRSQTIAGQKVKLTLYGLYTDEDPIGEESVVYMIPLQVFNGQYNVEASNTQLIVVKAETKDGSDFAAKDVLVDYTDDTPSNNSYWAGMLTAPQLEKAVGYHTNQQLIDGTMDYSPYTYASDIYKDYDGATQTTVQKDLWIMTDPAKYKGFRIDKTTIAKGTGGKGARIDEGWWFALLQNFGHTGSAARIVWLDEAQATAIYGVKEVNAAQDGAIYNLQGVRVSNPTKGLYIQNGKKFIVK